MVEVTVDEQRVLHVEWTEIRLCWLVVRTL